MAHGRISWEDKRLNAVKKMIDPVTLRLVKAAQNSNTFCAAWKYK